MKAKALIVTAPGSIELGEVEIPEPRAGEVLVRAAYSCVSPGTELRCLRNEGGAAGSYPYVPGYAMSGTVVRAGPGVDIAEGTQVYAGSTERCSIRTQWGGHVEYAVRSAMSIIPIPPEVNLAQASVLKLAAIAHRGTRFSRPAEHPKVAVIGLGPIGQLSARIHAAMGATVVGADISENRLKRIRELGIPAVDTAGGIASAFAAHFPDGADVVVDATGVATLLPKILPVLRSKPWNDSDVEGPRYIIQGSYPGTVALPYEDAFQREISLYVPRDQQRSDIDAAIGLLASGRLNIDNLIDTVRSPESAPATYAELMERDTPLLTVLFDWAAMSPKKDVH